MEGDSASSPAINSREETLKLDEMFTNYFVEHCTHAAYR